MTDKELLDRYSESRDQQAFAELVGRYVRFVYGIAQRRLPAEAEDITQAVFLLLSEKSKQAGKAHSLAGWLFRVTRYCCLNARRLSKRRVLHEWEAGRMAHESSNAEAHQALAQQLDGAIARLPKRYQEAIFLRYHQGKSLEETGTVLGVSAAAAGKIANRALERLRLVFAKSGFDIPATAVGAVLAEEAARAIPADLSKTIIHGVSGSGGPLLASKVGVLAHGTGKMLVAGYWKAAAVIAAGVSLASATGLAIHQLSSPAHAAAPAAAVEAAPPVDESKVDGEVCIASGDFLLDAEGAARLKSLTEAVPADAAFFEFRQGDSEALRLAVKDMQPNGQLLSVNQVNQMNLETTRGFNSTFAEAPQNNVFPGVARDGHAVSVGSSMHDDQPIPGLGTMRFHSDGQQALLTVKVKDGTAILQTAPLDTNGQPFPPRAGQVAGTERLEKPFHIQWDGTITPGRALVIIGDFGPWKDDHLVDVRFIAAYKATATEIRYIDCLKGNQWLDLGPQGLRNAVDPAIVWAGSGEDRVATPAAPSPWVKHLSDGSTVEMLSIAQERDLPLQRWSPDGQPMAVIDRTWAMYDVAPFPLVRPPLALAAIVRITSTKPLPNNGERNRYSETSRDVVLQELDHLRLWVGAGNWSVQPIEERKPVTIGKSTITLERITTQAQNRMNLVARGDLYPEMEIHLGVITKDHKQLMAGSFSGIWQSVAPTSGPGAGGGITMPADDPIDHYVVFSRPREEVVFEGFKSAPLTDIPDKVTPGQARAAEVKIDQREWAVEWADYQTYLARVKTFPRDATTPAGAMCTLLDKVATADIEGIRACITGDDVQRTGYAHLALARAKALRATVDKFGEQNVYRAALHAWNWGDPRNHVKPFLDPDAWSIKGDTASTDDNRIMYLRGGRWCDPIFEKPGSTEYDQAVEACELFIKDVQAGKFKDAQEATKALESIRPGGDEIASLP